MKQKRSVCLLLAFLMILSIVPSVSAEHQHDFSNTQCSCGAWKPIQEEQNYELAEGVYYVPLWKKAYMRTHPYQAGKLLCTLKSGKYVAVDGYVVNGYGNKWYKVWYQGKVGYIVADKLCRTEDYPAPISVTTEGVKVPSGTLTKGRGFSLSGKIKSNWEIRKVTVAIDDFEKTYYPGKSSFDFATDGPDRDFKFGTLESTGISYIYKVNVVDFLGYEHPFVVYSTFYVR